MGRLKNGSRMSHISVISNEFTSAIIDDNYDGILKTKSESDTMLSEADVIMETENSLSLELDNSETGIEITTISFVGNEQATPNATVGQFKV